MLYRRPSGHYHRARPEASDTLHSVGAKSLTQKFAASRRMACFAGCRTNRDREQRCGRRSERGGYPSDLRDAGSARLAILEASPGGRSRKTDMRAAMTTFSICCAPGAAGALCHATAFRRARRSTTSFARSRVMASRRRSGPSCTWRRASDWPGVGELNKPSIGNARLRR